jgi:adenylate cyclase
MRFRSFQSRLVVLFGGLLVLVQGLALLTVDRAHQRSARREVDRALAVAAGVLQQRLAQRATELVHAANILAGDYAFKQAVADGDTPTILSALESLLARVEADAMAVISPAGTLLADTLRPDGAATPDPGLAPLLAAAAADDDGQATGLALLGNEPYQVVVVPLRAPDPIAHIVIGFRVGDGLASAYARLTQAEVSLVRGRLGGGTWTVFASSLPPAGKAGLATALAGQTWTAGQPGTLDLDERVVAQVEPLATGGDLRAVAVVQRSLAEALAPVRQLRLVLSALFLLGVLLSLLLASFIARSVTRPVRALADAAARVEAGDLDPRIEVGQSDEIGDLATAFTHMVHGLAERDRVRDLLGKVVSPEIAQELLSRQVELGGEERPVTVLFSDVRGFTQLSEGLTPRALLALLNRYLTRMSAEVERHGGVVDKYVGDAIMALFGAPLAHVDDAGRAVSTALGMRSALAAFNAELAAEGRSPLAIGIGIHSDVVVAGNMGSASRLNYTVIGDGVNLASRLESLTKHYGVAVLVSAATAAAAPEFRYRELDRVRVKGRQEAVTILEPLGRESELSAGDRERCEGFAAVLAAARRRDFTAAATALARLEQQANEPLYALWRDKLARWSASPLPVDWDCTTTFREK